MFEPQRHFGDIRAGSLDDSSPMTMQYICRHDPRTTVVLPQAASLDRAGYNLPYWIKADLRAAAYGGRPRPADRAVQLLEEVKAHLSPLMP